MTNQRGHPKSKVFSCLMCVASVLVSFCFCPLNLLPLGPVTKSTRGRVQILLTDKSYTLTLGIQLETNLSQGSRNQIPRVLVYFI